MKHRHNWCKIGWSGKEVWWRCKKCPEEQIRPHTERSLIAMDKHDKFFEQKMDRQNKIADEFDKKFRIQQEVVFKGYDNKTFRSKEATSWKWEGYELIRRVEKWATKYPKDVFVCSIDDTHFSSSVIVFILHRPTRRKLWGTSVIVLTQCDNKPPKEFFMYPSHREGIQEALAAMAKYKADMASP